MNRSLSLLLFFCTALALPLDALAQDDALPTPPPSRVSAHDLELAGSPIDHREEARFELEMRLLTRSYSWSRLPFELAFDVAIPLTSRVLFYLGLSGGFVGAETSTNASVGVPLGVEIYFAEPTQGTIVPTLRIGGQWTYSVYETDASGTSFTQDAHAVLGELLGGASWAIDPSFLLGVELGAYVSHTAPGDSSGASGGGLGGLGTLSSESTSVGFVGSLTLSLRL